MAIVGTAFVRLRVIGDKLKNDIAKATESAVKDAAPDLTEAGGAAGDSVAEGMGEHVESGARSEMDRIGDSIGEALGNAMGASLSNTLRRRIGTRMREGFSNIAAPLQRVKERVAPVFEDFGDRWAKASAFKFKGILSKLLIPAISGAVLALPSALAFVGAAVGAVAATAVTAIAALGPAFAGAGAAGIAAFSAVKISAGLIGLAMKQQTPQLEDFQERLDTFKTRIATPIQAGLLSGLNASMRLLSPVVTALEPQLTRLGMAAGDVAIGFADAMRQGANMERLGRILDTNNQFITDAGGGVSKLGQAFVIVLDALRPVTTEIGQMIGQVGDWALRTTEAGDASGRLAGFIERSWNATKYFVGILWDFGVGVANIFQAAFQASGGMTTTLHDIAQNFRAWTGDPANQERMVSFFERMRDISGQLLDVLGRIGGSALRGLEGTNVQSFSTALQTLVSIGGSVAQFFNQIREAAGPRLQTAFQNFADLLIDLANSGVIGTVASALSMLFESISFLLNIPGIGQLLAFGAGLLAVFKTVSLLITVLGPVIRILVLLAQVVGGALVAAFGWIPVIIGLVVAALVWFFTQTEIGRQIIAAVWDAIVTAFNWAKDAILTALSAVWGFLQATWDVVSSVAQSIWGVVQTVFGAIGNFFTTVWNAIYSAVSTAVNAVWNVISTVFMAIWNFIFPLLNTIFGIYRAIFYAIYAVIALVVGLILLVITTVFNAIWGFIQWVVNAIWDIIRTVFTAIYDFYAMIFNAIYEVISTVLGAIWDVITTVWNAVWGFLRPIIQGIWDFISGAWNGIVGAISGALSAVWGVVTSVWNSITGFIRGVVEGIVSWVVGAWQGMVTGIQNAFSGVADFFSGIFDGIGSGIRAAINAVLGVINTGINFINDNLIDTANQVPFVDIPHIPQIPLLAKGGVVDPRGGGTLAMIAEAGRPERVEPLDPDGLSKRDRALIGALSSGAGEGANVQVYIGTRELTELVDFVVEDREDRLADRITTGTKG